MRGAGGNFDVVSRPFTDHEIVDTANVPSDCLITFVAGDADGLADDDAAERNDRDVRCAPAAVGHHVAAGPVDRQAGTDRSRHRFLDDVNAASAREFGGIAYSTLFN